MGRTIYCTRCAAPILIDTACPPACPACGSTTYRSGTEPRVPFTLSVNDRRFLRSLRIGIDDDRA